MPSRIFRITLYVSPFTFHGIRPQPVIGQKSGSKKQQPNPIICRWKDATSSPSPRWDGSKKSCRRPSITPLTPFLHPAGSSMTVPWPRDRYFLHFAMAARAGGRWAPDGEYIKLDLPRTMPARLGIAQYFQDAFCQMFINLSVAGNRLGNFREGIMIPVVLSAVAYKYTTIGL